MRKGVVWPHRKARDPKGSKLSGRERSAPLAGFFRAWGRSLAGILIWSLLQSASAAPVNDAAMRIAAATGQFELKAALMEEWIAVEEGELLLPGDLLRTCAGSSARLTCPDGSQLQLAPQTTLDIRKMAFESDTRLLVLEIVLWQGRVTLRSQLLNPISTQRLRTPDFTIEPLGPGTEVEVAYDKATGTTVTVLGEAVKLVRGESISVLRAGQCFPLGERSQPVAGPALPSQPAVEPRESPPVQGDGESSEGSAALSSFQGKVSLPSAGPPPAFERPSPAGIPPALWQRMSPSERADLEARLATLTEEQRQALQQMTAAQWQAARSVARTLACQTHLQQIGDALLRYAQEHQGTLPPASEWQQAILPYLREREACWDCPEEGHDQTPDYLFNSHLAGVRLSDLRQPRLTVLVFEGIPRDERLSGTEADLAPRHEGAVNILFADGHVRTMLLPLYRNVRWQP